ncbi:TransThyretin-Related family domain [Caenorhabditis elegans]|uniref:TransThyretin-Related family domain n=1 Tax=Caenorhabditis elegans TaxID=6239 RepID=Q22341_CAEEL|nr:TransThyretin-Related family domain [Caenorhabditis elegans]CCD63515.1 TransThyretin-Related family domain [Caenorhabditis elegans]|eukprot:NP_509240.2 TransThyretin-Related family domain [Caenorhabditis elegans]
MSSVYSCLILLTFIVASFCISIEIGNLQSVSVNGTLLCNDKPAKNIKVKLYEEEAILDVLLDERFTKDDGTFEMAGSKSEVTTIDPKLNIYHKCNYDGICVRKISILIPTEYITNGEKPARTFNVGELNLASKFSGQSTDCFN